MNILLRISGVFLLAATAAADTPLPDALEAGWQGQRVCERLHEDERQRVLRCTFPPGVGHERHFHAAHFGDGIDWHDVLNVGDTTSVYLIVEPLD